jgi:hypothetical protein
MARENCCDRFFGERHLRRILTEYVGYFNGARPHPGINQRTSRSAGTIASPRRSRVADCVIAVPVLGGLHHEHRLAT